MELLSSVSTWLRFCHVKADFNQAMDASQDMPLKWNRGKNDFPTEKEDKSLKEKEIFYVFCVINLQMNLVYCETTENTANVQAYQKRNLLPLLTLPLICFL